MIATDTVVQVHMPKTGGTKLRQELVRKCGGKDIGGGHDPCWRTPTEYEHLAQVGTLRDPWSWYASLYGYAHRQEPMAQSARDALLAYGQGEMDFRSVLYGWTHLPEAKMPEAHGVVFSFGFGAEPEGQGLYSASLNYFYDDTVQLIDTAKLGPVLVNKGPRSGYPSWYDAEMLQWVYDADIDAIAKYQWAPFSPSPVLPGIELVIPPEA